ncbi:hypothetical protein [Endozoicomonas atrinae]|uniref:hypothetical protein n=1 Tax=Endozoicomonas atrinae TaxID=1333660 RepID=UPI000825433D|nr:hypothetical protein [Endozoicomonas atrinae]
MKTFGKIESRFWISDDIQALSDSAKLMALYLLTTGHGNLIGIFKLSRGYMADDLCWDLAMVHKTLAELESNNFLTLSERGSYLCIHRFMDHNPTVNQKQIIARLRALTELPERLPDILPEAVPVVQRVVDKLSAGKACREVKQLAEQVRQLLEIRSEEVSLEKYRNREEEKYRSLYKTYVRSDDRTPPRTGEVPPSVGSTTGTTPSKSKSKSDKARFSESFEQWWSQYPKREGDKGNKTKTFGHYKTRLGEGNTPEGLLANLLKYARYCDETQVTGTQYVKTTTAYLNNPDNVSNPWKVNYEARQRHSGKLSLVEQVEQANAHILHPEGSGHFDGQAAFDGQGVIYDVEPEGPGEPVFDDDRPVRAEVDQCIRSG